MNNMILQQWLENSPIQIGTSQIEQLIKYASHLNQENQKYNLTGLKEQQAILKELIINSITPLARLNVPRGTRMLDMGTGAGIPGIPLCIVFPHITGLLIDSNHKKVAFINSIIELLGLQNVRAIAGRSEEILINQSLRESFNLVVSRAMGNVYMCIELAAQYLTIGGHVYLYSNQMLSSLAVDILDHAGKLGFSIMSVKEYDDLGLLENPIAFKKVKHTPDNYPRRFSVIKRESQRFN